MFEQLDYVYMPSQDVAADVKFFTDVLGARLIFAIDGMGTRVAMVALTDSPPRLLLAGHLEGDVPVLLYRVADLDAATAELRHEAGPTGTHWRSRRARCGRSSPPAGNASGSTSGRGRRSRRRSRAAATSDAGRRALRAR